MSGEPGARARSCFGQENVTARGPSRITAASRRRHEVDPCVRYAFPQPGRPRVAGREDDVFLCLGERARLAGRGIPADLEAKPGGQRVIAY
jgi:hypothetical protein